MFCFLFAVGIVVQSASGMVERCRHRDSRSLCSLSVVCGVHLLVGAVMAVGSLAGIWRL